MAIKDYKWRERRYGELPEGKVERDVRGGGKSWRDTATLYRGREPRKKKGEGGGDVLKYASSSSRAGNRIAAKNYGALEALEPPRCSPNPVPLFF